MKKIVLIFVISFVAANIFAQSIITQGGLTITNLIQDTLINGCIQVSNITVNNNGAYGYFRKGASQFPFKSGIILSTGAISNAQGPNNSTSMGSTINSGSDPDLVTIASGTINDATVIQFDFIPATNSVLFRYIFGSEEFPEFANTYYNDVFGFFLSGPGISGPYSNGAINIATLPNNQPVTINNVHNFNYYIAAPNSGSSSPGSYGGAVQYDGNTIILTAFAYVQACETYHIKLAVGDRYDSNYDSGVFLEAGSFVSGESISIVNTSQVGGAGDLWEGCENYYVINREEGSDGSDELTIDIMIMPSSTATESVDFTPFPSSITIPPGQMSDTIFYSAFNDGLEEGHETIIVSFYTACPCGNMSTAVYDTIWIYDAEFIKGGIQDMETFFCGVDAPSSLNLVGECNIDPNVGYLWSTGETTSTITVPTQTGSTTYYLTMTDVCGNEVYDSVTIRISDIQLESTTITNPSCYNECDGKIQLNMIGTHTPFSYRYANSLYSFFPDSVHNTSLSTFENLCPAMYKITVTDAVGCYKRFERTLQNPPHVNLSAGILNTNIKSCVELGAVTLTAQSNQPTPIFLWSNSATTESITINPVIGQTFYWVKIFDECGHFKQDFIQIEYSLIELNTSASDDTGSCNGSTTAFASGGINPYNYYWLSPIGSFGPTQTGLCAGTYNVQVTDAIGCQTTQSAFVGLQVYVPQTIYDDIFTVFPNPAKEEFVINYKKDNYNDINVKITDIKGNVVYNSGMNSDSISIKSLSPGIYFVNLYDLNGIVAIQKIVITK